MDQGANNPAANKLGAGVNEEDLAKAILKSGYPLQTLVAECLSKEFQVQQEWSYLDKTTRELRNIDILAGKWLYDLREEGIRVRPTLNLIVECKQSDLPYVFFLSSRIGSFSNFPLFAGLRSDSIIIKTDDDPSSWEFPLPSALGLHVHDFIVKGPPNCMSFSKCVRKGSDLELSGSDPFNNIILPILKAMHHFKSAEAPPETARYFDAHLTLGVAILDAPMVGVTPANQTLKLVPWVRVARHEFHEVENSWERQKMFAIDVIHKDFLGAYLEIHALPFAAEFAKRALAHQRELASGKGFVPGMGRGHGERIDESLRPR